jgi:hypothetical protein
MSFVFFRSPYRFSDNIPGKDAPCVCHRAAGSGIHQQIENVSSDAFLQMSRSAKTVFWQNSSCGSLMQKYRFCTPWESFRSADNDIFAPLTGPGNYPEDCKSAKHKRNTYRKSAS